MIYKFKFEESILLCMYEEEQEMKNNILNKIWTL